jgi:hypothetical protein
MLLRLPLILLVLLLSIVGCEQQGEEINTNNDGATPPTNEPTTAAPDSNTENTEAAVETADPGATPPSTEEEESANPNDGEGEEDGTGSEGVPSESEAPKEETPN